MVDDFCEAQLPPEHRPGPAASLSRAEVLTLAIFGQWQGFGSKRGFYRYAQGHLRTAFPNLPARSQFNRLLCHQHTAVAYFRYLAHQLRAKHCAFETRDAMGVPTRDAKRRGVGWLPGLADIGWSNRLGWYEGFHLLLGANPEGIMTGYGCGSASSKDQVLVETFFVLRTQVHRGRLPSVGEPAKGPYVVDKGFEGKALYQHWWLDYGAQLICSLKRSSRHPWSCSWRRRLAALRQIVETVGDKLQHAFRLDRERPHEMLGFQARLVGKAALHNFCIWLNQQLSRPKLAFADLIH